MENAQNLAGPSIPTEIDLRIVMKIELAYDFVMWIGLAAGETLFLVKWNETKLSSQNTESQQSQNV